MFDRVDIAGIALLAAALLSACAGTSDRPISSSDKVFGKYPAGETMLRLNISCPVASGEDSIHIFPAGAYKPVSADSRGVFYVSPGSVEVRRGEESVWIWEAGVHFPFGNPQGSVPYFWVEGVNLEWGSVIRAKRWPVPQKCRQPFGTAMAIVHKGVEVSASNL